MHICNYIADFEYDDENGHHVVDYKGCVTPVFRLKRKLIKALYGVDIELVWGDYERYYGQRKRDNAAALNF